MEEPISTNLTNSPTNPAAKPSDWSTIGRAAGPCRYAPDPCGIITENDDNPARPCVLHWPCIDPLST